MAGLAVFSFHSNDAEPTKTQRESSIHQYIRSTEYVSVSFRARDDIVNGEILLFLLLLYKISVWLPATTEKWPKKNEKK